MRLIVTGLAVAAAFNCTASTDVRVHGAEDHTSMLSSATAQQGDKGIRLLGDDETNNPVFHTQAEERMDPNFPNMLTLQQVDRFWAMIEQSFQNVARLIDRAALPVRNLFKLRQQESSHNRRVDV